MAPLSTETGRWSPQGLVRVRSQHGERLRATRGAEAEGQQCPNMDTLMSPGLEGGCPGCSVPEDSPANSKGQSWAERAVPPTCRQAPSSSSPSPREGGQRRWQAQLQKPFSMLSVRRVTCSSCPDT